MNARARQSVKHPLKTTNPHSHLSAELRQPAGARSFTFTRETRSRPQSWPRLRTPWLSLSPADSLPVMRNIEPFRCKVHPRSYSFLAPSCSRSNLRLNPRFFLVPPRNALGSVTLTADARCLNSTSTFPKGLHQGCYLRRPVISAPFSPEDTAFGCCFWPPGWVAMGCLTRDISQRRRWNVLRVPPVFRSLHFLTPHPSSCSTMTW